MVLTVLFLNDDVHFLEDHAPVKLLAEQHRPEQVDPLRERWPSRLVAMAGKEDRLSFCKIPTTESDREATCGLKGPCYSLTRSLREIRLEGSPELLSKNIVGSLIGQRAELQS
jgi:hypothetical protein